MSIIAGWPSQTETLLDRVARGDHEAFAQLYARHARRVNGFARRILRDRAEAEEVVQDVFVQVWRQAGRFDPLRGTSLAWLLTIARTRALDRLRRRACRREEPGAAAPKAATAPAMVETLALRRALGDLPPDQRRALELAYYGGLTHSEVARRLGKPLGTIKTWIRKGLISMRPVLRTSLLALWFGMDGASAVVHAQTPAAHVWREVTPSAGAAPEARRNGAAVYDPVGRRIVIFGGIAASGHLNDAWAFDLVTLSWTRLETHGTPPAARLGHDAVYDSQGRQMVVWAGQDDSRFFNDVWVLDLTSLSWRELQPPTRPQARYGSASIFDPFERRLVTFAGFTDLIRRFQDTQAFDLDTNGWEDLTPAGDKPEVRCLLTAAFDPAGRRMIVYGGQRSGPLADIWAFDLGARSWTSLTPADGPPGRFFAASFVDARGRFHVFGGQTARGETSETWMFDLGSERWSRLEIPEPPPRNGMLAAYVDDEDRFVVFGGTARGRLLSDVWELLPSAR